jgi:hypothetical protein
MRDPVAPSLGGGRPRTVRRIRSRRVGASCSVSQTCSPAATRPVSLVGGRSRGADLLGRSRVWCPRRDRGREASAAEPEPEPERLEVFLAHVGPWAQRRLPVDDRRRGPSLPVSADVALRDRRDPYLSVVLHGVMPFAWCGVFMASVPCHPCPAGMPGRVGRADAVSVRRAVRVVVGS